MVQKRAAHSLCQTEDYVYAFGGMDEKQQLLGSVERIKITTDSQSSKWELLCEMP